MSTQQQEVRVGDNVEYFDEYGHPYLGLVTAVWGPADAMPSINLIYVSGDSTKTDSYGRQIDRATSVVSENNQSAHGRWWRFVK